MQRAVALILITSVSASSLADPFRPSQKQQVDLGLKTAADIRKKEKVLPDSDPRTQMVRRVGNMLVRGLSTQDKGAPWKYSFDVIDSKEVNAFALPGGPMFVYTGLLAKFTTEDEVAAVMGHELTHVRKEHWARQYAASMQKTALAVIVLGIFRANKTATDISGYALTLDSLNYSRKDESQADDVGMDTMVTAGFNPDGMVSTFKILQKVSGGKSGPEWLSDHPNDGRRIDTALKKGASYKRQFPAQRLFEKSVAEVNVAPAEAKKSQ